MPHHKTHINKMKLFRKICTGIVEDRKAEKNRTDSNLLNSLLNEDVGLSDQEIIDNFVGFFSAGMDTTAHLVTMVIYQLAKYPELAAKLTKEIQENYFDKQEPTIEDLKKMEYFDGFIKETLRHYSPAPGTVLRTATADHMIGDIKVRTGDLVTINAFCNWFDEKNFEDADKFDPDRWQKMKGLSDPFVYAPFWAGPRNCIG